MISHPHVVCLNMSLLSFLYESVARFQYSFYASLVLVVTATPV